MGHPSTNLAFAESQEILDSCLPGLIRHFAGLTGDVMLAEDLVQEAALVVLERPHLFLQLSTPQDYCFGIVRKLYLGQLRKEQRRATFAMVNPPEIEQAPDVVEEVAQQSQRCWLQRLIQRLPARRDRVLLERVLTPGQDKASICDALGLSSRHYDRVLHRATKRLRAQVCQQAVATERKPVV